MAGDGWETRSAGEDLPGLRRHAPPLRSPKPRRTTVDGTASSGPSNHLPADDATWSVCADYPLHACCAEDGYAAGGELASTAGVSGRWRQTTAAAQTRNASADGGASSGISPGRAGHSAWPSTCGGGSDRDAPERVLRFEMARHRLAATNSFRCSQSSKVEQEMVFR